VIVKEKERKKKEEKRCCTFGEKKFVRLLIVLSSPPLPGVTRDGYSFFCLVWMSYSEMVFRVMTWFYHVFSYFLFSWRQP
jgi:hypothetical protein